jgi:hypothetical protein
MYLDSSSAGNCSRSICCSSTYIRCTGLAATSAVEVEDLGQDLVREARGDAAHALVHPGVVAVLLVALGARIGVLEVLAVIDLHLAVQRGVLRLLQPGEDGELAHHLQRARGALGLGQQEPR